MNGPVNAASAISAATTGAVTIVTQTRVRPESATAFTEWQDVIGGVVAAFPGFLHQTVIPPSPPAQVDWVILQRFTSSEAAIAWLHSEARRKQIDGIEPMLVGRDDIHIVRDGEDGVLPSAVSAVISTRIRPGQEMAYRAWERRVAAAQTQAPGFQGYRLEPPVAGVQDDWLAIVRFDSEENLQAWLDSPERQALLGEATGFVAEFHARIARTGFDQWFPVTAPGQPAVPVWKQNMLVLLMLYPVVFLFGLGIQTPLLTGRAGLPFAVALFIGNVVSVILLNYLVPWTSTRFAWWLRPASPSSRWIHILGIMAVLALYTLMLVAFTRLA
jgi:antibiotic biosynthesis monooxygenase (ABM) superfamily enzyme